MIAQIECLDNCTYMLSLQNLNGLNARPKNVFLWGSSGTGKTLLLAEILKIYLAYFKLKNIMTKVWVIVYHNAVSDDCKLIEDLKEKYLTLGKNEADIQVMTFKHACKGKTLQKEICIFQICEKISLFVW